MSVNLLCWNYQHPCNLQICSLERHSNFYLFVSLHRRLCFFHSTHRYFLFVFGVSWKFACFYILPPSAMTSSVNSNMFQVGVYTCHRTRHCLRTQRKKNNNVAFVFPCGRDLNSTSFWFGAHRRFLEFSQQPCFNRSSWQSHALPYPRCDAQMAAGSGKTANANLFSLSNISLPFIANAKDF